MKSFSVILYLGCLFLVSQQLPTCLGFTVVHNNHVWNKGQDDVDFHSTKGISSSALWMGSSSSIKEETRNSNKVSKTTKNNKERDASIKIFLEKVRDAGQIGSKCPPEVCEELVNIAKNELSQLSDEKPAQRSLNGFHTLLHSQSQGGSSGNLGPFVGRVQQEFIDETNFINSVSFFFGGFLRISLYAERTILDDTRIRVKFRETVIQLGGIEVVRKDTKGQGVWNNLFVGEYIDDNSGTRKLLRVMETPSLFVIQQDIE